MRIPPEILDRIFSHLEFIYEYDEDSETDWADWNQNTDFRPQSHLFPLLFVCREWLSVAQRRLYRSVGIGGTEATHEDSSESSEDSDEQRVFQVERDICGGFYRTVNANPHFASLVRILRLRTCNPKAAHEEIFNYMQLFRICKNVESVSILISEWSHFLPGELKIALEGKDLVELYISKDVDVGDHPQFRSSSDIIPYMRNWPRLRRLIAYGVFHDLDEKYITAEAAEPSKLRGRCPALREILLPLDKLGESDLIPMAEMAPNVERFTAFIRADAGAALQACLRTWSTTLTHLSFDTEDFCTIDIAPVCPALRCLRSLEARATNVPPKSLLDFEQLESLGYYCTANDLIELAGILAEAEQVLIPSLRKLYLMPDGNLWEDEIDWQRALHPRLQIRHSCSSRGISLVDDPNFDFP